MRYSTNVQVLVVLDAAKITRVWDENRAMPSLQTPLSTAAAKRSRPAQPVLPGKVAVNFAPYFLLRCWTHRLAVPSWIRLNYFLYLLM